MEKIVLHHQPHPLFGALGNEGATSDQHLIADLFSVDPWLAMGLLSQQRLPIGAVLRQRLLGLLAELDDTRALSIARQAAVRCAIAILARGAW